jgi:hypothetical protein
MQTVKMKKLTKIQYVTIIALVCCGIWEIIVMFWAKDLPPSDPIIRGDLMFIYPVLGILAIVSVAQFLMGKNKSLALFAPALFFVACQSDSSNKNMAETEIDSLKVEIKAASVALQPGTWWYASKTKAPSAEGEYNYHFIKLEFDSVGTAKGVEYTIPYGTDGASGSLQGVYNAEEKKFFLEWNQLAEGERYVQQVTYRPTANGLELGYEDGYGKMAQLPHVSSAAYNALFDEYKKRNLTSLLNTTDRTRLSQVLHSEDFGYTDEQMEQVRFLEAALDLDHNRETIEYLLYIMDPLICGSGGCTLYVLNDSGELVSRISSTKLPVYTTVPSIDEEQEKRGTWKALYVYSKGFRQLVPKQGKYPSNASMAPEVLEEQLLAFPEQYQLRMDYLD